MLVYNEPYKADDEGRVALAFEAGRLRRERDRLAAAHERERALRLEASRRHWRDMRVMLIAVVSLAVTVVALVLS
jgi:hypothetical protein